MTKSLGDEVTLGIDLAGGSSFTTIGQIIDLSGPSMERTAVDVTTRDSTEYWGEHIKGFKDAGEVTFGVVLDMAGTVHGTAALLSDFSDDTTIPQLQLTFPGSKTITIGGFMTGYEPDSPHDDALTADITFKLTGKPTFA